MDWSLYSSIKVEVKTKNALPNRLDIGLSKEFTTRSADFLSLDEKLRGLKYQPIFVKTDGTEIRLPLITIDDGKPTPSVISIDPPASDSP